MFKNLKRKIAYTIKLLSFLPEVKNWWEIIFLTFSPKEKTLYLRSGVIFKLKHILDTLVVKEVFVDGDYDISVRNPKTIIDIGANIGTYCLYASRKYPNAKIYSYEPSRNTFEMLSENIKNNNNSGVKVYRLGVADREGKGILYSVAASGLSSLLINREGSSQEKVDLTTLKKIFEKKRIRKCDILKIDCEGGEYEILFSLPDAIFAKIKNIILEYHDKVKNHNHDELVELLKLKKFKIKAKKHAIEEDIGIIYAKR